MRFFPISPQNLAPSGFADWKSRGYMSLIIDAIKLSFTEKKLHNLNYPFKTMSAIKVAKQAVDRDFSEKYKARIC
jgi:hypothetical protein